MPTHPPSLSLFPVRVAPSRTWSLSVVWSWWRADSQSSRSSWPFKTAPIRNGPLQTYWPSCHSERADTSQLLGSPLLWWTNLVSEDVGARYQKNKLPQTQDLPSQRSGARIKNHVSPVWNGLTCWPKQWTMCPKNYPFLKRICTGKDVLQ